MSKQKKYYVKLIQDHKKILRHARVLIGSLLEDIEGDLSKLNKASDLEELYSEESLRFKMRWGDKESITGVIIKLTTILLKLIPMEIDIAKIDLTKADILELEEFVDSNKIPEEDIEIIERYTKMVRDEEK